MSSASIRDNESDLRSQVQAAVALARPPSVLPFVTLVTLLGANVGGAPLGPRVLIVWLANVLAVAFAFMINDVEDADDDALVAAKAVRNPISAGRLSPRAGYGASALAGAAAMALYAMLGTLPTMLGGLCIALGVLYSWRPVRLKAIPVADLISHTLMLAALQLLCAYTAFQTEGIDWLVPCVLVVAVSAYGQLVNQVRDLDGDRQAGINHTTARIGRRVAELLTTATGAVAVGSLPLMVWLGVVPLWAMALAAVLTATTVIVFRRASPADSAAASTDLDHRHLVLHIPVLTSGTIALLIWLIVG